VTHEGATAAAALGAGLGLAAAAAAAEEEGLGGMVVVLVSCLMDERASERLNFRNGLLALLCAEYVRVIYCRRHNIYRRSPTNSLGQVVENELVDALGLVVLHPMRGTAHELQAAVVAHVDAGLRHRDVQRRVLVCDTTRSCHSLTLAHPHGYLGGDRALV